MEPNASGFRPATLTEVMAANPGISILDASKHLSRYNQAVHDGLPPPPLNVLGVPALVSGAAITAAASASSLFSSSVSSSAAGFAKVFVPPPPPLGSQSVLPAVSTISQPAPVAVDVTKVLRQIYIGNLPPGITPAQLTAVINSSLVSMGLYEAGSQPALSGWVSPDAKYGFVDMRSSEDAGAAISRLNGQSLGANQLRISRPKNYPMQPGLTAPISVASVLGPAATALNVNTALLPGQGEVAAAAAAAGLMVPAIGAPAIPQASPCVMLSNLPKGIQAAMVQDLASPFGPLRAFNTILMNGYTCAVIEYENGTTAAEAAKALATIDLGGTKLQVQVIPLAQAALLLRPVVPPPPPPKPSPSPMPTIMSDAQFAMQPSAALVLSNMVSPEDLQDSASFNDLVEDTREECAKFGAVVQVVVPRDGGDVTGANEGAHEYIYVQFQDEAAAAAARANIDGRKFGGKRVGASFFPLHLLLERTFRMPADRDDAAEA